MSWFKAKKKGGKSKEDIVPGDQIIVERDFKVGDCINFDKEMPDVLQGWVC